MILSAVRRRSRNRMREPGGPSGFGGGNFGVRERLLEGPEAAADAPEAALAVKKFCVAAVGGVGRRCVEDGRVDGCWLRRGRWLFGVIVDIAVGAVDGVGYTEILEDLAVGRVLLYQRVPALVFLGAGLEDGAVTDCAYGHFHVDAGLCKGLFECFVEYYVATTSFHGRGLIVDPEADGGRDPRGVLVIDGTHELELFDLETLRDEFVDGAGLYPEDLKG